MTAVPAPAATRYYSLAGSTAGVENGCPAWVLEDAPGGNGDDCSYHNGHPLAAGNSQWIGPVFSAGHYAPGTAPQIFTTPPPPVPVTEPAPDLPIGSTTGIPIRDGFLAIDDRDTLAGSDDIISGTIEFDAFDRNVATSPDSRIVETFGRIIHTLARVRVSSATPNAAGGFDYIVASSGDTPGYPARLTGSTTAGGGFSDSFPSQVASQSSPDVSDVPYWAAPGAHGIAVLDGSGYTAGTTSTATVWDYACEDGSAAPVAHDCDNSYATWSGDGPAGFSNVLLKISTSSTGQITAAEAYLVQEWEYSPTLNGTDSWVATSLEFTGSQTDLPVAFDDRKVILDVQAGTLIDVLANDLPGVPPTTVSIESGPAQGTATVVSNQIQYLRGTTPESVQEITYRITDAANHSAIGKAQVVITDQILCADDSVTGSIDTPVTVDVLANDSGYDIPPVVLTISAQPAAGSVVVNPDRTLTFTPPAGKGGQYVMRYFLADGTNRPVICKLTVKLPGTPQAVDDSAALLQNGGIVLDVLANDLEVSDTPVTLTVTQAPAHGTTLIESSGSGPRIRYTPAIGYAGPDSYKYTVTDADGDVSNEATVSLDVVGPPNNDVPRCENDEAVGQRNAATIIDVLANDTGLNALPLTLTVTDIFPADGATAVVNADNTITFTPATDRGGTFYVSYSVREAVNNPAECYAVIKVDDVPVAKDDNYDAINFGRVVQLGLLNNDTGLSDGPLTLQITAHPAHGTVRICAAVSPQCPAFSVGSNPFVTYVYDDAGGFPASDEFRYRVVDANGDASGEAVVRITVRNVLSATDDPDGSFTTFNQFRTAAGYSVRLNVLANDGGLLRTPLRVSLRTAPSVGTAVVNTDNTITYTPPGDFAGFVEFSYTLTDADGASDDAAVTVFVFPAPLTDTGGSALDLPALLMLLAGLGLRRRRFAA